jgi:response regulator RpfG family c-di-GMP phosphodiesterase
VNFCWFIMGEVVENRSQETGKHVYRVAEIAQSAGA